MVINMLVYCTHHQTSMLEDAQNLAAVTDALQQQAGQQLCDAGTDCLCMQYQSCLRVARAQTVV